VRRARRYPIFVSLGLAAACLGASPAAAAAATTFASGAALNNSGDCLTVATACKTIGGVDGAIAKAGAGGTVKLTPDSPFPENVMLPSGVSLMAASGLPTISPAAGTAVTVIGPAGTGTTIQGIKFSSNAANTVELRLGDDAGSVTVTGNTFVDPIPTAPDNQAGINTTSIGSVQISGNTFTGLHSPITVGSPSAGLPGTPEISGNTITGVHETGSGITVVGSGSAGVTGTTSALVIGNRIDNSGAPLSATNQPGGVFVLDGGSFASNGAAPPTGLTMRRNTIIGGVYGVQDAGARAPVTLEGDVIAKTGSITVGGAGVQTSAFLPIVGPPLGGDLTATNVDIVGSVNLGFDVQDAHLTIDSSIVSGSIFHTAGSGLATCTITFSVGPSTSGDSCETFQSMAAPSFVNPATNDYHLTNGGNDALIDEGNPAPPPPGAVDFDGDPRAIDFDATCPLDRVRDIGADEINPGIPTCHTLVVSLIGAGSGSVTGPGISCPGDCSEEFDPTAGLDLTATPAPGSDFAGWGGACTGTSACHLAMTSDRAVTASFTRPPGAGPGPAATTTGRRAAALKKCKRKHGKARKRCKKRARRLPV
jgi:hypothetical protein